MLAGIITTLAFLVLLVPGVHIFIIFFVVGFVFISMLIGIEAAIAMIGNTLYYALDTYELAVLPLFILMGSFAARAGFAKDAFDAIQVWFGKLPGSLGVVTCWSNAAFGAVCGSSIAATAVFGKIALPEMERLKYDKSLSLGCIASAGTFSSMIPPSSTLIVIGIITEQSVGMLFMAGIIPGLFTAAVYAASILYRCYVNPKLAPRASELHTYTLIDKLKYSVRMWPIAFLAIAVLGGIYSGIFTTTESAAVGCFLTFFIGISNGSLRKYSVIRECLKETAKTSSMIIIIMVGALFYGRVLGITRLPSNLATFIIKLDIEPMLVVILFLLLLFFLGMFMTPSAYFMFSLPIFFPIIVSLGVHPVWFCIVAMKLAEIGAVTPPVGVNLFTLKGIAGKDVSIEDVARGSIPFILADIVVVVFLFLFPKIATWLPSLYLASMAAK